MSFAGVRNIVILTGAGVSAESGLATFRGPDGLWEGHRVEDVATPEAFARDPALVHAFYDARRAKLGNGRAQCRAPRAGAARRGMAGRVAAGHAECRRFARARGVEAAAPHAWRADAAAGAWPATSASAGRGRWARARHARHARVAGRVRPDIVWFGEMPYEMERIDEALQRCDLFVSIGTSGAVYPAAGFVQTARYCGAKTLEINLEPSLGSYHVRRKPDGHGGRAGAGVGRGSVSAPSPPTPARSRGRGRGPRPSAD